MVSFEESRSVARVREWSFSYVRTTPQTNEAPSISIVQHELPSDDDFSPPLKKSYRLDKQELSTEPEETSSEYNELEKKWFRTLERLHHCQRRARSQEK